MNIFIVLTKYKQGHGICAETTTMSGAFESSREVGNCGCWLIIYRRYYYRYGTGVRCMGNVYVLEGSCVPAEDVKGTPA